MAEDCPDGFLSPLFTWRSAISSKYGPKSPVTRHVLLALSLHMNERGGSCFPSTRRLEEETGLSRRSVESHLRTAADEGWLERRIVGLAGQKWRRCQYRALVPKEARDGLRLLEKELEEGGERGAPPSEENPPKVGNVVQEGGEGRSPEVVSEGDKKKTPGRSSSKANPKTYSPEFLELWRVHPRGSKRKAAEEYAEAIAAATVSRAAMLDALKVYVHRELHEKFHGHDLYRWIRDERWEQYLEEEVPVGPADDDDESWRSTGGGARIL